MKRIVLALLILAACGRETPVAEQSTATAQAPVTVAAQAGSTVARVTQPDSEPAESAPRSTPAPPKLARRRAVEAPTGYPGPRPNFLASAAQPFAAMGASAASSTCVKEWTVRVPANTADLKVTSDEVLVPARDVIVFRRNGDRWTLRVPTQCVRAKRSIAVEFVGSDCRKPTDPPDVHYPCGYGQQVITFPVVP